MYIFSAITFSYLLGSLSSAIIVSKSLYGKDIRKYGSGNAGATNALRILGKKAGALVFICDFSKGLLAVTAARCLVFFLNAPYECILFAGFFAQLGHVFPLFFKFRGGKGVATAAGAALGTMPLVAVIVLALFAVIAAATKIVSLSSAVCAAVYPLLAFFLSSEGNAMPNMIFAASCSVLILIKHAPNFARLLDGEEKRISFNKTDTN